MTTRRILQLNRLALLTLIANSCLANDYAWGQCLSNELTRLGPSDADIGDQFGIDVSIWDDVLIVGAWANDDVPFNSGSAYVYRFDPGTSSWIEEQKLLASDAAPNDQFGFGVATSGDVVVAGAFLDDDNGSASGAAYVFRFQPDRSLWVEEAKLTASDAEEDDQYGAFLSMNEDLIVIASIRDDDAAPADPDCNSGSAYIYRYDNSSAEWIEEAKLTASDAACGDRFGWAVGVSGGIVVIGADLDGDTAMNSGSVYVFRFDPKDNEWVEEAKLTASDAAAVDRFGSAVTISGDVAVIGAHRDDDAGPDSGSAYVFRFDPENAGWMEEQKLTASDAAENDAFGRSVSVWGDTAIIGALHDEVDQTQSGSAYVFRFDRARSEWIEEAKLIASDGEDSDHFGEVVSANGDRALIGAHFNDENGPVSGSAYVFGGLSDCNDNGELDLCDVADGQSNDVNNNGIPDECECLWDLDGDTSVGVSDLLSLLASWGPCKGCPADFDDNDDVGVSDLLALLANWGPCP